MEAIQSAPQAGHHKSPLENVVWLAGGDDLLRQRYPDPNYSIEQIADQIGVGVNTVTRRAKWLGLRKVKCTRQHTKTERNARIVRLLSYGATNLAVARALKVSEGTVCGVRFRARRDGLLP